VVKVHRSNFVVDGYVSDVSLADVAALARARDRPSIHDFGSGLLIPLDSLGLTGEPTAADVVRSGATVIVMSGDKLLGGPQAGIILGDQETIRRLAHNPLTRALRVDKLTIAALQATLALYRDPARARRDVPVLAMIGAPGTAVRASAERVAAAVRAAGVGADVVASEASVGGGAFPTARIPSAAVAIAGDATALERSARASDPPIVGRIAGGRFLLDVRTILPRDEPRLIAALGRALG
jgi:L-seryl-tRNA(Ser) seleniumtransferase